MSSLRGRRLPVAKRFNPDYEVGYKRPPRKSQFRPGQSGNPKGRPKGSKNFATALNQELNNRVLITETGQQRRFSKREVVAKQLVNKAVSGDLKAIPVLLNQTREFEGVVGDFSNEEVIKRPEDELVMASIIKRIKKMELEPLKSEEERTSESSNSENPSSDGKAKP
jgi:hypothetical protein